MAIYQPLSRYKGASLILGYHAVSPRCLIEGDLCPVARHGHKPLISDTFYRQGQAYRHVPVREKSSVEPGACVSPRAAVLTLLRTLSCQVPLWPAG
jgi:hypothetical protein